MEEAKEDPPEASQSKKKKKNKKKKQGGGDSGATPAAQTAPKKDQSIQILQKYIENLCFKIFEEKYEKTPDQQWARSLFDDRVYNALPIQCSKKVYKRFDFK